MAYTFTVGGKSVFGNKRSVFGTVNGDAISGIIDTGMGIVEGMSIAPISMNSTNIKCTINAITATSAGNGKINFSGLTSGDFFQIIALGH